MVGFADILYLVLLDLFYADLRLELVLSDAADHARALKSRQTVCLHQRKEVLPLNICGEDLRSSDVCFRASVSRFFLLRMDQESSEKVASGKGAS